MGGGRRAVLTGPLGLDPSRKTGSRVSFEVKALNPMVPDDDGVEPLSALVKGIRYGGYRQPNEPRTLALLGWLASLIHRWPERSYEVEVASTRWLSGEDPVGEISPAARKDQPHVRAAILDTSQVRGLTAH